jgi:pantoate--beta-alanine ligase
LDNRNIIIFAPVFTSDMELISSSKELKYRLDEARLKGSVGFVPTMGALHKGHLSLVERAVNENDTVVVSIFVNPNQFNDKADLERYPRNLEADRRLLETVGCDIVFAPSVEDIYPVPDTRLFDFGGLDTTMEGKFRPGHFNGVAQVVSRLFYIVEPEKAYFGLKDFQQLAVIRHMVSQLQIPVEIVPCPIVREQNGLAMSSRNELLSVEERSNAAIIYETLTIAGNLSGQLTVPELRRWMTEEINKCPYLDVEYIEIVDQNTLQPVASWNQKGEKIVCVAARCGNVRLIDNLVFN